MSYIEYSILITDEDGEEWHWMREPTPHFLQAQHILWDIRCDFPLARIVHRYVSDWDTTPNRKDSR